MASMAQHSSTSFTDDDAIILPLDASKTRRNSTRRRRPSSATMLASPAFGDDQYFESGRRRLREMVEDDYNDDGGEIAISSSSKHITPFLAEHIPNTYNPMSGQSAPAMEDTPQSNTKYCNRHRPDRKCRRQADEPSMEQLQNELVTLSQSDQANITHCWSIFSAAPAKQRNLILQGVLSACCFPQLSFLSSTVRDLIKIDFLALLPPELGFKILCYLDTTSLTKAAQVSRRWRILADDDVVWHKMCEQHIDRKCLKCGWGLPLLERKRLRLEKRQIQARARGRGINEWSPNITPLPESPATSREGSAEPSSQKRAITSGADFPERLSKRICARSDSAQQTEPARQPWKQVYKARFKVGTNWKHNRYEAWELTGHKNGVTCLEMRENVLASGSYDTTIKIWDLQSRTEIRTLSGHQLGVRCLQLDNQQLVSGSLDHTVVIWNWVTGEKVKTLEGPTGGVLCVHFDGNYLVAGSMDKNIYVWNTATKKTYRLLGHTDFVNSVKLDVASGTLLSASDDCTVRLWDLETRRVLRIFEGHVGPVQQVLPLPHEFEVDESDLADYVDANETDTDYDHDHEDEEGNVDFDNLPNSPPSRPRRTPTTPPPPLTNTPLFPDDPSRPNPPQYMLTGSLDLTIVLWHVPSGRILRRFFGHTEGIWALAADSLRIVSGAEDRTVKVWDPRTGVCEHTFCKHSGPVNCVGLSGERLVSGGEDCDIRVLDYGLAEEVCLDET